MYALKIIQSVGGQRLASISTRTFVINFVRTASQNVSAAGLPDDHSASEGRTHFGYQTIKESEKEEKGKKSEWIFFTSKQSYIFTYEII